MIYTLTLNPAIDYVMEPLTLDMGFTNRSSSEDIFCGGNGINVSTILNELECDNVALGIIGGFTGRYLLETLIDRGVNCNFVRLEKGATRINVKLQGVVMTIVNGMGPKIPQSKIDEIYRRLDRIKAGDTLVLTGSIPKCLDERMYLEIMNRLAGRGIRFVVDAPGQLLMESLSARPFLIKPNNHEVGRIFGEKPEKPEEVMHLAHKLHELGAVNVIVSCGKWGSALVDEAGNEHICGVPKCRLVNATGSGDSMVAGFLAKLEEGADYDTALNYASACGSATASSKGLATKARIEKLYNRLLEQNSAAREAKQSKEIKEAKTSKEKRAQGA
ncbi:MAG: 1-phosphofructokinase [Atopobiaceae bacterium]|nr:1-phosphofructokinase [Atopobiaceae bacterium]